MLPCSVSDAGVAPLGAERAPLETGLITIHSVGDTMGELSRGVEAGLDSGVASVEHELRGVWGLWGRRKVSVGVQERMCSGEGQGDGLVIFGGGTGLWRSSMSFSPSGNLRGGQGGT